MLTRTQILENRKLWIARLKDERAKKLKGKLSSPEDLWQSCCLGHGCLAVGLEPDLKAFVGLVTYGKRHCSGGSPIEFSDAVGLYRNLGEIVLSSDLDIHQIFLGVRTYWDCGDDGVEYKNTSLALINDTTDATPQQIGEYLQSVIEGGENTPFIALSEYPE